MKSQQVKIINRLGLHARAAALLVKLTHHFKSEIIIETNGKRSNARDILSLLMLAAICGNQVNIIVEGADEDQALQAVVDLFAARFHEQE